MYLATLFVAYTGVQPVTLKLMAGQYDAVSLPTCYLFSVTHCMACFTVSTWKYCFSSANVPPNMSKFKRSNIFFAAVLDVVQLTLLIISAGIVRGTLLVVLLQSVIPLRSLVLAVYDSSDNLMMHAISGTTGLVAIMLSFTPWLKKPFSKGPGLW